MSDVTSFNINGQKFEINPSLDTLSVMSDDSSANLNIGDINGNVLVEFKDGHIKTQNFDSRTQTTTQNKFAGTFSVIGDSYSACSGYLTPSTNSAWYPNHTDNDVTDFTQMWWYLFAQETGMRMDVNNSYSGATICYAGYSGGTSGKTSSFITRCDNIGTPNLLLIFGGTNDSWAGASVGEYIYSDWTEDDLTTLAPGLAYMLDELQKRNDLIGTKIIFILNNGLRSEINTCINTVCEYYNVSVLTLVDISKESGHPNQAGMIQIKEQLIEFLETL